MTSKRTVKDPVCGMDVDAREVENRSQHEGTTYYFCSTECKDKFDSNPDQFAREVA